MERYGSEIMLEDSSKAVLEKNNVQKSSIYQACLVCIPQ